MKHSFISFAAFTLFASSACANALSPAHFYVRADLGAAWMQNQSVATLPVDIDSHLNIKQALDGQLGIGYIFTPYWRMDFTGNLTGKMNVSGTCTGETICTEGLKSTSDLSSGQLMLTAYLDFGRLFGTGNHWFNPYVGGGIGAAHNKVGTFTYKLEGEEIAELNAHSSNSFAWHAVGGVALGLTPHLMLDMFYGYTHAGSVDTGTEVTFPDGAGGFTLDKPGTINMNFQQWMLGLRYRF